MRTETNLKPGNNCHGPQGVLDWRELGYDDAEIEKLMKAGSWE